MAKTKAHIRKCYKCGDTKSLEDFSKNRTKYLGYDHICKLCKKSKELKRRTENLETCREVNRRSFIRNRHKWKKMWADYQRKYCKEHPQRHRANGKLNYYVGIGRIIAPLKCSECNSTGRLDAHHSDYEKPLDVDWVCKVCHKQLHKELEYA